ncbi:MAG TPA: hypothetical protein VEZ52_05935 [Desulfovibrio sp.]|uniref:hypothetical protein n=1 Tax=Desulfovibrio sp. TaxID=885 RepID=UPI002D2C6F1D|nr:hypothetical protein [Desulfovibrio sp.]HZF61148.1 hypothetical protein [Desulfovibrio sp.]
MSDIKTPNFAAGRRLLLLPVSFPLTAPVWAKTMKISVPCQRREPFYEESVRFWYST